MGQKIPANALRLGINKYWSSRWIFKKNFILFLEADYLIRKIINKELPRAGIVDVIIERKSLEICKVNICSAKPGIVVGKNGQGLKNLLTKFEKVLNPLFKKKNLNPPSLDINVLEVKKPYLFARYVLEVIANDLEKGIPTRKALKKILEKLKLEKGIFGVKIKASGRVDGATIRRTETVSWGRLPLSKLIADIDYAHLPVLTKYGIVGLKIWIYKGDKDKYNLENVTT